MTSDLSTFSSRQGCATGGVSVCPSVKWGRERLILSPTTAPLACSSRMVLTFPTDACFVCLPAIGPGTRGQEVLHSPPDRPQGPRGHVPDLGRQRQRTRTSSKWRATLIQKTTLPGSLRGRFPLREAGCERLFPVLRAVSIRGATLPVLSVFCA